MHGFELFIHIGLRFIEKERNNKFIYLNAN